VLAIAIGIIFFVPAVQNGILVEGVLIDSAGNDPYALFSDISSKNVFLISPQMNERAMAVDHAMFNGTALFIEVIAGNKRSAVQVLRVLNDSGEFDHCLTNFGDVNRSEELGTQDCLKYLSTENGVVVLIEQPNPALPQPIIEVAEGKLIIKPKTNNDLGSTCFVALRLLFRNSQEIIDNSNNILDRLN
jgi:hypothetical protein